MLHIMRKMCNIPPPLTNIYGCFFNFRHNYVPGFDFSNAIIVIGILKAHYTVLKTFIEPLKFICYYFSTVLYVQILFYHSPRGAAELGPH